MGKVIYYCAVSVDGFIADVEGGVGWLSSLEQSGEDYGFSTFYERIGVTIQGSATYEQVLSFGVEWPYKRTEAIVMTRRDLPQPPDAQVRFYAGDPTPLVETLCTEHEKDIWLIGGAKLAAEFAARNLIDEYDLTVMPVLLGKGIPLLLPENAPDLQMLRLVEHQVFKSGAIRTRYTR